MERRDALKALAMASVAPFWPWVDHESGKEPIERAVWDEQMKEWRSVRRYADGSYTSRFVASVNRTYSDEWVR